MIVYVLCNEYEYERIKGYYLSNMNERLGVLNGVFYCVCVFKQILTSVLYIYRMFICTMHACL